METPPKALRPPQLDATTALWQQEMRRDLPGFYCRAQQECGDVVEIKSARSSLFCVSDPQVLGAIFQGSRETFRKGKRWDNFRQIAGHGLITAEPETWMQQRRNLQPVFLRRYHEDFATRIGQSIEATRQGWSELAREEKTIDLTTEMSFLTLATAGHTLFGTDLGELTPVISSNLNNTISYIKNWFEYPAYKRVIGAHLPHTRHARFRRAKKELHKVAQIVAERRRVLQAQGAQTPHDLLGAMIDAELEAGEKNTGKISARLRDQIITFLFVSHETTAVAVSWMFYVLSQYPEVETKLHDELDRVLSGRTPTRDDLSNLPFLRQVAFETLRLYPPVWIFLRETWKPEIVGKFQLPANAAIGVSPYVVHRHPDFWDEPERFDPERFSSKAEAARHPLAYIPFGGGPRQCMGKHTALLEAQLIVAGLAQHFKLRVAKNCKISPVSSLTLWPSHQLPMTLQARS